MAETVLEESGGSSKANGREPVGFNLSALMLIMAMFGLGLAYWLDTMSRSDRQGAPGADLGVTVAGRALTVPSDRVAGDTGISGFADRLDLVLDVPLAHGAGMSQLTVSLVPRSQVQSSAVLLDTVYSGRFQARQLEGPPGLVGKPLAAVDGYADETVWYDPLSANPFVAKCNTASQGAAGGQCVRTVVLGGNLAAIYGFSAPGLVHWKTFDSQLAPILTRFGAL